LPPSGKPKSIEAWICLVGLISEAPSGKNPEIKIPGFLLFPVQHFDDVVAELGMQRAGWLQFRAGEDHFIEGRYHLALAELTQIAAAFA
jgi:hypothetical protein